NLFLWTAIAGGDWEVDCTSPPGGCGYHSPSSTDEWGDHYLAPAEGGTVNWAATVAIQDGTPILSPTEEDVPGDLIQEIIDDGVSYVAIGDANLTNFDRND